MRRRTPSAAVVLAVVALSALSACGGKNPVAEPTSPNALPTPTATPSATPTAQASTLPPPSATMPASPSVTSAQSASRRPSAPARSAAPAPATKSAALLTGNGIDSSRGLVEFGTSFGAASAALRTSLGAPGRDSGEVRNTGQFGGCDNTRLRALDYGGGALRVLFGADGNAPLKMLTWQLSPKGARRAVPRASALVGDVTTFEFGVGTTVAQLRSGAGQDAEIRAGDEMLGPTFRVKDQSPGFYGKLTGTKPGDTVTSVEAGKSCGE